jgi:hypothetical protein
LDSVIDGIFARGTLTPAVANDVDAPDELPDDALPASLAAHVTRRKSLAPPPPMEQYVSDDTVIPDDGDSLQPQKRKGFLGKLFGKK